MINKKPRVSVLICVYNAENFLRKTLESILKQSYSNLEILILDNNSKDSSLKILKEFAVKDNRIKVNASSKNLGAYGGLNFLLNKVKGTYVMIADHDDLYHPKKVEKQIQFLEQESKYVGCGTSLYVYFEKDNRFKLITIQKKGTFSAHPSLIFRYSKEFKYNLNVKYKTDTHFMKYVLCKNKPILYNLVEPLYLSRIRKDNNNLSRIWNKNLTFEKIFNYYEYSKDKTMLIKLIIKKFIFYNFFRDFFLSIGTKSAEDLKKDELTKVYFDEGLL